MSFQDEHIKGLQTKAALLTKKINALEEALIMETDASVIFKYQQQLEDLNAKLITVKEALETAHQLSVPPLADNRLLLHDHHRHTCNRQAQAEDFTTQHKAQSIEKIQFYAIHGTRYQAHEGFFNRVAYDLEEKLRDHLGKQRLSTTKVFRDELSLKSSKRLNLYKENLIKDFFASFSISVNAHEPLLDKKLDYLVSQSPCINGWSANDYVCFLFNISALEWEDTTTPAVIEWFINEFCACSLAENTPHFRFFFSLSYKENSPMKEALTQSLSTIPKLSLLPELRMVQQDDIERWFFAYEKFFPRARTRDQLIEQHFSNTKEHYMEDVEWELKDIIKAVNEGRIR